MIRTSTPTGIPAVGEVPFGTHFREPIVALPVLRAGMPQVQEEEDPEESERASSRRVLVADDNHDSAESLGMLLELEGHEVQLAYDGQQALDAAASFLPDVMLLDIGLPKMDGFEVATRLRQDRSYDRMLLVAVTGYGTDSDRERARAAGFDHHLVKPVDPRALRELVAGT